MGLSEDGDDGTEQRFEDLCCDLNMDRSGKEEAWQSFQRISTNYTLEGDGIHWLACALYVACRQTQVSTVSGRGLTEGNCVSLTRLLRSTKLSLIEFFKKMKKWSDMSNMPQKFRDKVEKLERNFAVSTVIFKKFLPIFIDIFRDPADDPPRAPRSRKQKRLPCSVTDVFNFAWTMFVQVKGNFPAISDDLVNSYHLLLCCLDWFYANALLSNRRDLLNPHFSGLPDNFQCKEYKPPPELPCIIDLLVEKHEGLLIEAKGIKEHWWKPYVKKLFDTKKVLKGKVENLTGILEIGNYESNSKAINHHYEEYVLNVGDFDERIFLGEDAEAEIGTPAKMGLPPGGDIRERVKASCDLRQHFNETRSLAPSTPLTGRRYLKEKEAQITPVSTATQSVHKLQALLSGRKTCPSDALLEVLDQCSKNPKDEILERVKEMGETFCTKYSQPSDDHPGSQVDFAKRRLQLGESLYFKALENIMMSEKRRLQAHGSQNCDLSILLGQDIFHKSLFSCCLEIVIFSYNSQRTFPWIVEMFDLSPYYVYKVIELLIRAEEGLSRDVVKHLNRIEEMILESMAWKSGSPLWDSLEQLKHDGLTVPSVEEASLPSQIEREVIQHTVTAQSIASPILHPAVKRVAGTDGQNVVVVKKEPLMSPSGPTASDRFNSPIGSAKRRLFGPAGAATSGNSMAASAAGGATVGIVQSLSTTSSPLRSPSRTTVKQSIVTYQEGKQIIIPVHVLQSPSKQQQQQRKQLKESILLSPARLSSPSSSTEKVLPPAGSSTNTITTTNISSSGSSKPTSSSQNNTAASSGVAAAVNSNKPRRTGSLALFFRKVYHLASVRLQDLCERLDVDRQLHLQIWTCFEHTLVHHADLMTDRHLDQMLMCAIYVACKVTRNDRSFQDIMRFYRLQPQAVSHVYRSVLLAVRSRHSSGGSDSSSSRHGEASSSSSPVNMEKDAKETKRTDRLSTIRSSSTLPISTPTSQPPTPTHCLGSGSTFEFEDRGERRGDLIKFYNDIFVWRLKKFALKFSAHNLEQGNEAPLLSPLPVTRAHPQSPRRVSHQHSVYVSPHKNRSQTLTPQSRMLYCFNRSPARDLRAINNMIRINDKQGVTKRPLLQDANANEDAAPVAKRIALGSSSSSPMFSKKVEQLFLERQATNGSN